MNPFESSIKNAKFKFYDFKNLSLKSYDKYETAPYSKTRIILMNGTEFESNWFYHQFARHCHNNEIRKELSLIRRSEQQQQKRLASLKPIDESILQTTLSYEQLAVDLTAILAKREKDLRVKHQLDFALLEDFDHLYRFTDMLEMDEKENYKNLIGSYTEIMPGRPTIAEHRHPYQDIKEAVNFNLCDPITKLNVNIITAAEQQTMNYYMNVGSFYHTSHGRKLYSEIAMIEEEHVSGYESLKDTDCTWLECMLMHEYTECYLYYSMYKDETDERLKLVYEEHLCDELTHLQKAQELLLKYEGKDYLDVIFTPAFPELLSFKGNKEYIRDILKSVNIVAKQDSYPQISELGSNDEFCTYQNAIIKNVKDVPSHAVMDKYINENGEDLRYETAPHPVKELQNRKEDNVCVGREIVCKSK